MYEEQYYFGMGKLLCKGARKSLLGKKIKAVSKTFPNRVFEKMLSQTEEKGVYAEFLLPGRDKYSVTLYDESDMATWTEDVAFGYGEYKEMVVGYDAETWLGIQAVIEEGGEMEAYEIGQQFALEFNHEAYWVDVLHIDYLGNNVIFGFHECLKDLRQINTTKTNAGNGSGAFGNSALSRWLNGEFFDGLPSELKEVISPFSWIGTNGGSNAQTFTETHNIWLPTEKNIINEARYSNAVEANSGSQFEYYIDPSKRIKTCNGVTVNYWTASARKSNTQQFCCMNTKGASNAGYTSNKYGVAPCFAIVKTGV